MGATDNADEAVDGVCEFGATGSLADVPGETDGKCASDAAVDDIIGGGGAGGLLLLGLTDGDGKKAPA